MKTTAPQRGSLAQRWIGKVDDPSARGSGKRKVRQVSAKDHDTARAKLDALIENLYADDPAFKDPGTRPRGSLTALWIGRIRDPRSLRSGHRTIRSVSHTDYDTARAKLDRLIEELDADNTDYGVHTVAGWLKIWCEEVHIDNVNPATTVRNLALAANHINPHLGGIRLAALDARHIRRMLAAVPTTSTALAVDVVLRRALDDAVREQLIDRNPCDAVAKPRHTPTPRDQLTAEQAGQLLTSTAQRNDPFHTRWMAAFMIGARQGELLGLQSDRVDTTAATLDISWQLQPLRWRHGCAGADYLTEPVCGRKRAASCPRRRPFTPRGFEHQILHANLALVRPKTKASTRLVPIPQQLADAIQAHMQADTGPNPHRLIWHEPDGKPIRACTDWKRFKDALATAGLAHVPLHTARGTTATTLLDAGVDEQARMKLLGHVSATAHRTYARINNTHLRNAINNLNHIATPTNGDQ